MAALIAAALGLGTAAGAAAADRYELTIRNINQGQNFSPPVIALHTQEYRLFELGQPAPAEFWRLAEDGVTAGYEALSDPEVREVIVGRSVHRRESPVFTTTFEASPDLLVSVAAMLSLTNDGFVAAPSVRPARRSGGDHHGPAAGLRCRLRDEHETVRSCAVRGA